MQMNAETQQARSLKDLVITPMQPNLATDISAIDLREPLTVARRDELWALLLKYKFIIFRDQDISREQFIELAQWFGDLLSHPLERLADCPIIQPLMSGVDPKRPHERSWTSDSSYRAEPPQAVFERSVHLPIRGGDTVYADAGAAYRGLSSKIKDAIDGLTAVHSASYAYADRTKFRDPAIVSRIENDYPPVEHPVVRTHPLTGEKLLYVNQAHTTHIVGLSKEESARLLGHLFDQFKVPEYHVRIKWLRKNCIGFYDAAALQYFAVEDFDPTFKRYSERIEIAATRL